MWARNLDRVNMDFDVWIDEMIFSCVDSEFKRLSDE